MGAASGGRGALGAFGTQVPPAGSERDPLGLGLLRAEREVNKNLALTQDFAFGVKDTSLPPPLKPRLRRPEHESSCLRIPNQIGGNLDRADLTLAATSAVWS